MKTVTLQTQITPDGKLCLDIPSGLPPGPVDVVVIIQPQPNGAQPAPPASPSRRARSGVFLGTPRQDVDIDVALDEMNTLWKARLLDLQS